MQSGFNAPITVRIVIQMIPDRTYRRALYINLRLEEARDCIYRLPPPGNTTQTRITQFFQGTSETNNSIESSRRTGQFINLLQWNAQSLTEAKAHELAVLAAASGLDVLCISELGHRRTIPGYKVVSTSSTGTQSGIFCREGVPTTQIDTPTLHKFEAVGIQTQMCLVEGTFALLHVYIAPQTTIRLRKHFWNTVEEINTKHSSLPLIITGDLNTLSPEISPNHSQSGHQYFSRFLEKTNITILNDNTPTRGCNTLDVSMCNDLFLRKVAHWQVLDELDSDHLPTLTQTSFELSRRRRKGYHTIFKYLDVDASIKRVKQILRELLNSSHDLTLDQFYEIVQKNLQYRKSTKRGMAYWTKELSLLKRKRNKARKRLRRANDNNRESLQNKYDGARKEFRAAFRKTKQKFRQDQVETIASQSNSSKTWQITHSILPGSRKRKKKWITNTLHAKQEADEIANKFASISSDPSILITENRRHQINQRLYDLSSHSYKFKPISMRELYSAAALANNNSAAGADGITTKLIRGIVQDSYLGPLLCKLFNRALIAGDFPNSMKVAKIRALPKQVASQYRPISLLPTMGKLLERIITARIREQVAPDIHPAQQGCRSAHGTSTAMARLFHQAGIAAASPDKHFGLITFDFSKAYDRVNRLLLIEKLMDLGVDTSLILLVNNWLQDREFFVHHRGARSTQLALENGIPQGSSLSVLLWIIYVNDLDIDEDTSNIYVDDVIIWASGDTRKEVQQKLTQQAQKIVEWSKLNHVRINYDKTEFLINDYKYRCSIRLGDRTLRNKKKTRYLGVNLLATSSSSNCILDYDLKSAAGDIKRRCSIIKPMRRLGFSQHQIETVSNGFIGGKLRYYTPWIAADLNSLDTKLSPLVKAYNQIMRTICGALRTTPISLLHAASRVPTLSAIIQQDCTKLVLNSIASNTLLGREYLEWNGSNDGWSPLGCAWNCFWSILPATFNSVQDRIKPTIAELDLLFQCKFNICKTREDALKCLEQQNLLHKHASIEVWSDGSFSNASCTGGTGYMIDIHAQKTQLTGGRHILHVTSSYDSEAEAFLEAIEKLETTKPTNEVIAVYSDSHGLLSQLEALVFKPKLVDSIIFNITRVLGKLIELGNSLFITWVPGHCGIEGNEHADRLAKSNHTNRTRSNYHSERKPRVANYQNFLRKHLESSLDEYLQKKVQPSSQNSYPDRSWFKGKEFTINNQRRVVYPYKTEELDAILFRARTGHTYTRDHLSRFGLIKEVSCRLCSNSPETVEHLALHCTHLKAYQDINDSRQQYHEEVPSTTRFNDALWTHPKVVSILLKAIKRRTNLV